MKVGLQSFFGAAWLACTAAAITAGQSEASPTTNTRNDWVSAVPEFCSKQWLAGNDFKKQRNLKDFGEFLKGKTFEGVGDLWFIEPLDGYDKLYFAVNLEGLKLDGDEMVGISSPVVGQHIIARGSRMFDIITSIDEGTRVRFKARRFDLSVVGLHQFKICPHNSLTAVFTEVVPIPTSTTAD